MPESLDIRLRQIYYGVAYTVHRGADPTVALTAASIEEAVSAAKSRWLSDKRVTWQVTDSGFATLTVSIDVEDETR